MFIKRKQWRIRAMVLCDLASVILHHYIILFPSRVGISGEPVGNHDDQINTLKFLFTLSLSCSSFLVRPHVFGDL